MHAREDVEEPWQDRLARDYAAEGDRAHADALTLLRGRVTPSGHVAVDLPRGLRSSNPHMLTAEFSRYQSEFPTQDVVRDRDAANATSGDGAADA